MGPECKAILSADGTILDRSCFPLFPQHLRRLSQRAFQLLPHPHLLPPSLAWEVLSQRNRQIDEALARRATLETEKEAIRKQIDALNLALPAFSEMIGVVPDCPLHITVEESSKK